MEITRKINLNMFRAIWICIILFFFSFYIHSLYLAIFSVITSVILIGIDAFFVRNKYQHTWSELLNISQKNELKN